MAATHSTQWFWSDWLGDQDVRRLTPAERGVWIDLLALAAASNPVGYVCDAKGKSLTLEEIARVTNAGSPEAVAELIKGIVDKGAASRDRAGRLFNRRMVRHAELTAKRKLAGKNGGASTRLKWQSFNSVPQQTAQQMPRSLPRSRSPSLTNKYITSTESGSAREKGAIEGTSGASPELVALIKSGTA